MKRCFCLFLAAMMIAFFPLGVNAVEQNVEIISFGDGSYLKIELKTYGSRSSGTVTGSRNSTYYGTDGSVEWIATLTGKFSYTGSTATCTSSTMNVSILESNWYTISKTANRSGNTATGSVTMGLKNAGLTVKKVPVSLSISCDVNGNLS